MRFIVPYTPGAINDFVARLVAQKLGDAWSRQVVVDNRPGGGTRIGTDLVAKANPDGHTLSLYTRLPYDTVHDFAPVTQVGSAPYLLVCNAQLPVKSVKDLIVLAKAKPGQLSYASTGSGGSAHLMGEMFKSGAGVDMVHILHGAIVRLLNAPDVRERLEVQGVEVAATTPEQFAKFIREEIVRWGRAVKVSGAKPD